MHESTDECTDMSVCEYNIGDWGTYDQCDGGVKTRTRTVSCPGTCPGSEPLTESTSSSGCEWLIGDWGDYEACSTQCGDGNKTRTRSVDMSRRIIGGCGGDDTSDARYTELIVQRRSTCMWDVGVWSSYSACILGSKTRTRGVSCPYFGRMFRSRTIEGRRIKLGMRMGDWSLGRL